MRSVHACHWQICADMLIIDECGDARGVKRFHRVYCRHGCIADRTHFSTEKRMWVSVIIFVHVVGVLFYFVIA